MKYSILYAKQILFAILVIAIVSSGLILIATFVQSVKALSGICVVPFPMYSPPPRPPGPTAAAVAQGRVGAPHEAPWRAAPGPTARGTGNKQTSEQ